MIGRFQISFFHLSDIDLEIGLMIQDDQIKITDISSIWLLWLYWISMKMDK